MYLLFCHLPFSWFCLVTANRAYVFFSLDQILTFWSNCQVDITHPNYSYHLSMRYRLTFSVSLVFSSISTYWKIWFICIFYYRSYYIHLDPEHFPRNSKETRFLACFAAIKQKSVCNEATLRRNDEEISSCKIEIHALKVHCPILKFKSGNFKFSQKKLGKGIFVTWVFRIVLLLIWSKQQCLHRRNRQ